MNGHQLFIDVDFIGKLMPIDACMARAALFFARDYKPIIS